MNVYDRVLNRIEKYALVFSAVVLFFIIVSTVFSTSIMRVGDRDMVLEKPKSHYGYADDIVDFQKCNTEYSCYCVKPQLCAAGSGRQRNERGAAQYRSADSSAPDNGFSFVVSC